MFFIIYLPSDLHLFSPIFCSVTSFINSLLLLNYIFLLVNSHFSSSPTFPFPLLTTPGPFIFFLLFSLYFFLLKNESHSSNPDSWFLLSGTMPAPPMRISIMKWCWSTKILLKVKRWDWEYLTSGFDLFYLIIYFWQLLYFFFIIWSGPSL